MKKILFSIMLFGFIFGLAACAKDDASNTGDESTATDVIQVLTDAGYSMTVHDADARTYFQTNTVGGLDLELSVTDLSIGYLDGSNWVQVIGFASNAEANDYKTAVQNDDSSVLIYIDGNTVVQTYTQAVIDLFE